MSISWPLGTVYFGFPDGSAGKESACNAGDTGDMGLIPGSGRSPGGGHGNPFQDSCLGSPVDRGAWRAAVHRATDSRARLKWPSRQWAEREWRQQDSRAGCHWFWEKLFPQHHCLLVGMQNRAVTQEDGSSLIAQLLKNPPAMHETSVWFLGREDALEKGKATHSSTLAWRIPWTV